MTVQANLWPPSLDPLLSDSREITIEANTRYILEEPNVTWLVKENSGDIFAWEKDNEHFIPIFIQQVEQGQLIFSSGADDKTHVFFIISTRPTKLMQIPIKSCMALVKQEPDVKQWMVEQIEKWTQHVLLRFDLEKVEKNVIEIPFKTPLELAANIKTRITNGHNLPAKQIVWIQCQKGEVQVGQEPHWVLKEEHDLFFPIDVSFFIEAKAPSEIAISHTEEIVEKSSLYKGLFFLHQTLFVHLEITRQIELERFVKISHQKETVAKKLLDDSIQRLGQVFEKKELYAPIAADPLTAAMNQITQNLEVQLVESPLAFDTLEERVYDICKRTNLFYRQINLKDNWWHHVSQPILALHGEKQEPVAVIPISDTKCVFFDPARKKMETITRENASAFAEKAFTFYVPLLQKKINFISFLKFTFSRYKKETMILSAIAIALALLNLFLPFANKQLFDLLSETTNMTILKQLTAGLFVVALSTWIFNASKNFTQERFHALSLTRMQMGIWGRLLNLPISFFRQYSSGETMNRYFSFAKIHGDISREGNSAFFSLAYAIFYYLQMFIFDAKLTLYMTLAFIFVAVIYSWCVYKQTQLLASITQTAAKIEGFILQIILGLNKIRIASAESRFFNLWAQQFVRKKKMELSFQSYQSIIFWFTTIFPPLTTLLIYWLGLPAFSQVNAREGPQMSLGSFVGFATAFGLFTGSALSTLQTFFLALKIKPLWDNAKPILAAVPEEVEGKESIAKLTGKVLMDHVSFKYEDTFGEKGAWVLDDISLYANPGEMIGIVGPSGSGKSTIVRQLLGFETPQKGAIYYNDKNLADLDVRSVRSKIGTVLQKGDLFSGNIYENIVGSGNYSLEEVQRAIYYSGFENDLKALPMGLHTMIPMGGGSSFSGGQKQRLMLARALIASPKILLLDEATSALDNRNQDFISSNLDQLKITRVIIAHRLSTIRNADRIYVLVNGKIVQSGTFLELSLQPGVFSAMLKRQSL